MSNLANIERKVMSLSPEEREHLALCAWKSLGDGSDPAINKYLDPDGIEIAKKRDQELSKGEAKPISHAEFLRRISPDV
jgi:hypothetical protein